MNKTKAFDCVDIKHRGAEALQKKLKGMTVEEELAFWSESTEKLRHRIAEAKAKRAPHNVENTRYEG